MKKALLIILLVTAMVTSCKKTSDSDVYCLVCMDEQGNDLGIKEHQTLEWAKNNSGPGKQCFSWAHNADRSCP